MVDTRYVVAAIILVLLAAGVFVIMQKPIRHVTLNEEFELKEGETVEVDGNIQIKFLGIVSDSRCPKGVQCVWAGEAIAEIEVNSKSKSYGRYNLSTLYPLKGMVEIDDYIIKLVSVEPQRMLDISIKNYTITLIVTKAQE